MGNLFYFFKEALRGFFQAKLMTFVSIVTIGVALFALGLAIVGFQSMRQWLAAAQNEPGCIVYITDSVNSDSLARARLIESIGQMPGVQAVSLVGKEEAWIRFERLYGPEMLDAVDINPFPASLEIALSLQHQSPEAIDSFKAGAMGLDGVEGVYYSREWIAALRKLRTWFLRAVCIAVPFIILALHFMIANTIKLTIYARRDLVTNMRFVGATDFYIKMPFVLEGMLQGMIGGALAIAGLVAVRLMLSHVSLHWNLWKGPQDLFLVIFCTGVAFGWIGSMSAVRKFLK